MLRPLLKQGFKVIGVDPSDTVKKCIEDGLTIYNTYFNDELATEIVSKHGLSDFFLSSNSFAHIDDMHEPMRAVTQLLKPQGLFVFEVECAILAEPIPASLLNAALRKPIIMTPMNPPFIPSGENAPLKINEKASPMCEIFIPIITKANPQ